MSMLPSTKNTKSTGLPHASFLSFSSPHVAPLGVKFYNGNMFPEEYRGDVFIAEHGSWNRTKKIGYRITRVKIDGNKSLGFITGALLQDGPGFPLVVKPFADIGAPKPLSELSAAIISDV